MRPETPGRNRLRFKSSGLRKTQVSKSRPFDKLSAGSGRTRLVVSATLRLLMPDIVRASAFSRVIHLASQRPVHEAFQWLHLQEPRIMDWQAELVEIAAPPFHERERALWLCDRFRELGLEHVEIDASGNALGFLPGESDTASPCVLLS